VAAAAVIVVGAKLNQQAVIASNDFPRINRGKSRGHSRIVAAPEQGTLQPMQPENAGGAAATVGKSEAYSLWKSTKKCTKNATATKDYELDGAGCPEESRISDGLSIHTCLLIMFTNYVRNPSNSES
jgi:hypothetical protein